MNQALWQALILAEEAAPNAPGPGKNPQQPAFWQLLVPLVVIFLFFQLFIGRHDRKQRARHQEMLKNLKKNDSVVTIGGIIGTVANVSQDGKEVTVKVDDNTRIRFRRDAIREVVTDNPPAPSGA